MYDIALSATRFFIAFQIMLMFAMMIGKLASLFVRLEYVVLKWSFNHVFISSICLLIMAVIPWAFGGEGEEVFQL